VQRRRRRVRTRLYRCTTNVAWRRRDVDPLQSMTQRMRGDGCGDAGRRRMPECSRPVDNQRVRRGSKLAASEQVEGAGWPVSGFLTDVRLLYMWWNRCRRTASGLLCGWGRTHDALRDWCWQIEKFALYEHIIDLFRASFAWSPFGNPRKKTVRGRGVLNALQNAEWHAARHAEASYGAHWIDVLTNRRATKALMQQLQRHYHAHVPSLLAKARFPFKRNRLRCVRCVSWLPLLRPSIPIGWRLRFLRFSFTQRTHRTQRKRLRLNGNRASCAKPPTANVVR